MSSESLIGLLSRQAEGDDTPSPTHDSNPVVAFIIGFGIIILASILNAAGLNLTKLDHVSLKSVQGFYVQLNCWLGPYKCYCKVCAKEGLVTTTMAHRNDIIHVRSMQFRFARR